VLKLHQESENVVQPGTPLIDIGNPSDLEVVADLLSTDAVQVKIGSSVRIDGWGGPPIQGRVSRIDPAGFLKISALGIEEQRVRTRIDLVDSGAVVEPWPRLPRDRARHDWEGDNVLTVPVARYSGRRGLGSLQGRGWPRSHHAFEN
jgi:HlyD family secretion protein